MSFDKYSIGIDFGTESARAVLVNIQTGYMVSSSLYQYPDGVIDNTLPVSEIPLPPDWALQNPADWLSAVVRLVSDVLQTGEVNSTDVVGLGIDFTSCTILPTLEDGTPLCFLEPYKPRPHAWPKLWKHHSAQPWADLINMLASERKEKWLPRYGGKISSEWLMAKALEILVEAPDIYSAADYLIEGADWIVWQLTGNLIRNSCCAGYKAAWHNKDGFPSVGFLKSLHPDFGNLYERKYFGRILDPGTKAGGLNNDWALKLGLPPGLPIAVPIIDAHSAVLGGGISYPGTMFMMMGTSTCHMLLSEIEVMVEGISGIVHGGIVSNLYAYEAGQASVGDIFAWFVKNQLPCEYQEISRERDILIHELLMSMAKKQKPGQSGLLALDWWNGCRTPLVDANLSGVILGYSLQTKPEDVYRALLESTAYGTRSIIELFKDSGVLIHRLRVGGGLVKNKLLLQIYSDCLGMPIEIAASQQPSALGAAILGAIYSGKFKDLHSAVECMTPPPCLVIYPSKENKEIYDKLFYEYKELVDLFGRMPSSTLKVLSNIRGR